MKLSVVKKLWTGFTSILLIMLIIGVSGLWALSSVDKEYSYLIDDKIKKVQLFEQLLSDQNRLASSLRGYLLYEDEQFLRERDESLKDSEEILAELDKLVRTASARVTLQEVVEDRQSYKENTDRMIQEFKKGNLEQSMQIAKDSSIYQSSIAQNVNKLIEHQVSQQAITEKELQTLLITIRTVTIGLMVLAVILSIVIAQVISRSIARPVSTMTTSLQQIAAGNFAIDPINIKNKDEIGDMALAFNEMSKDLRQIIENTRNSAVQLACQAEELSASSEESLAASEMVAEIAEKNLAASELQVSIVNDSVNAMEEMILGIDRINEDNEDMLLSSEKVTTLVQDGSTLMKDFSTQMQMINKSMEHSSEIISDLATHSEQIRHVTSVITAIAEQTNLLALNAAIEAARAGDHGKGFAVVAEEVRNLAEQSKQSAVEIGQMIDMIIQNVGKVVTSTDDGNRRIEAGLVVTEQTKGVFEKIEQAAMEVSTKVTTVSAAVEQIRAMTDKVSNGSTKVQELAQQSSAEAQSTSAATEEQLAANEEISSSAHTLSQLAESLQNDMARFTV
jgi:methyl-accepting chemotaxis protein